MCQSATLVSVEPATTARAPHATWCLIYLLIVLGACRSVPIKFDVDGKSGQASASDLPDGRRNESLSLFPPLHSSSPTAQLLSSNSTSGFKISDNPTYLSTALNCANPPTSPHLTFTMTVSLNPAKTTKIPPYLPDRNNYQPTHPGLVHVEFGKEGEEFNSCLKTDKVSIAPPPLRTP